jgi:hypothetical protein
MRYEDADIFQFDHFLCVEMRDHIFGLGMISLLFNRFERAIKHIMETYVDYTVADLLFDNASNVHRAKAIRALVKAKERDTNVSGHVEHLLTYFAICVENRNVLMHSSEDWAGDKSAASTGRLSLRKTSRSGGAQFFQLELEDIKRVFADMLAGTKYCIDVYDIIKKLKSGPLEKPVLPDRLSPHRYDTIG